MNEERGQTSGATSLNTWCTSNDASGSAGRQLRFTGPYWRRGDALRKRPLQGEQFWVAKVSPGSGQDRRRAEVTAADQPLKVERRQAARRDRVHSTHCRYSGNQVEVRKAGIEGRLSR